MTIIDKTHPVRETSVFAVEKAEYIDDLCLRIHFTNGKKRDVDFAPFLNAHPHPSLIKYQDPKLFKKFTIRSGNLNWNNYEMVFPLEQLLSGKIKV
jgi:hypothetical protein